MTGHPLIQRAGAATRATSEDQGEGCEDNEKQQGGNNRADDAVQQAAEAEPDEIREAQNGGPKHTRQKHEDRDAQRPPAHRPATLGRPERESREERRKDPREGSFRRWINRRVSLEALMYPRAQGHLSIVTACAAPPIRARGKQLRPRQEQDEHALR